MQVSNSQMEEMRRTQYQQKCSMPSAGTPPSLHLFFFFLNQGWLIYLVHQILVATGGIFVGAHGLSRCGLQA